nr:DUF5753 domain-containing protein [Streptomyces sp. SID12488]
MGLAKETKARGWWHAYGDVIPDGFDLFIGLEEAACDVDWYESELIPGLLQTADYTRTVTGADNPTEDDEEIERRVNLRIAHQVLLTRVTEPTRLNVVLNEAVLRRPVGGTTVMAGQLLHLLKVGEYPNVTIKVVPFSAGLHSGVMSGPFGITERTMSWLAGCRRLHRRYERKADHFLAFTSIACTLICYRRLAK